jgi:hypothetical protein
MKHLREVVVIPFKRDYLLSPHPFCTWSKHQCTESFLLDGPIPQSQYILEAGESVKAETKSLIAIE